MNFFLSETFRRQVGIGREKVMSSCRQAIENPVMPDQTEQDIGLLYCQFEREFPSKKDCLEELFKLARIEIKCRFCREGDLVLSREGRVGKCRSCKRSTWFAAGTCLAHLKRPDARLFALWLMQKGVLATSLVFSRVLGLSQSSAHAILAWVRFAVQNYLPEDAPLVHSSAFVDVFWKRSRETPAREHPAAEQDEVERNSALAENDDGPLIEHRDKFNVGGAPADDSDPEDATKVPPGFFESIVLEHQEAIYSLISDTPVYFETLLSRSGVAIGAFSASITILELQGKIVSLPGNMIARKVQKKVPAPGRVSRAAVEAFLELIRTRFKGISRKYLQGYLAAQWCSLARDQWSCQESWQACLRSLPANAWRQMRYYVSPLWVSVAA